jgi:glycosyltransferase involved in cell wall biosynthesis
MTIRVLHVIDHLGYGGAPVAVKNIAERMAGERIESIICALRTNPNAMPIDVQLVNLGYHKYNPLTATAIAKLCRRNKIDLIHAHLQKSIISCLLAKSQCDAKVIIHEHGPILRRGTGCIYRFLFRTLKSRVAIAIANSQATKAALCRVAGFDEDSVPVVSNFIDFARFDRTLYDRDKARDSLGIAENQRVVGFVGRLDPCKGADLLVHAAAVLCGKSDVYRFVIVGEGSQRRELEQLVLRLGLQGKVIFAGLSRNPAEVMVAFDLAVVPSRREAFGIAAIEFMWMNIPVVASAVDGLVEVIQQGRTGILLDALSPENIADAVEKLAQDDSLRQKLISEAKVFCRKFDGREQLEQIVQIYEQLVT